MRQAAAVLLAVAFVLSGATSYEQPAQVATAKATLIEFYGSVQTRHGTSGYQAARVGEVLLPGEGIKTGGNSRAQLSLGGNQYVRMDQNTQLLITHVQQDGLTSFKTMVGGVWVTIQKALGVPTKFEVQTPSVVAAARGTMFRCDVDANGDTDVFVYEGEVDVTGAEDVVRVTPDQFARARRGLKPALAAINADEDERREFVCYNRHAETLRGVGDPRVLVALSEVETKPQAAVLMSEQVVSDLQRLGFLAKPIAPDQLREVTFDRQGVARCKPGWADYYLVGAVRVQKPRPRPETPGTGLVTVQAKLVAAEDYRVVSGASARQEFALTPRRPGDRPNGHDREAVQAALQALAHEVTRQLAPRLIKDVVADRPAAVRVDLMGLTDPRQMQALKALLSNLVAEGRVTPLPRLDGGRSLLLTGALTPADVAQACRERGAGWVQSAQVQGRVVTVTFAPGALPPNRN